MAGLYNHSDPMVNARTYYDVLKPNDHPNSAEQRTTCNNVDQRIASSSFHRVKHVNWSDDTFPVHHQERLQESSASSASVSDVEMTGTTMTLEPAGMIQVHHHQQAPPGPSLGEPDQQSNPSDTLMELAAETSRILQQNRQTMKELEELRIMTDQFLDEVMRNPGNERFAQIWADMKAQDRNPQQQQSVEGTDASIMVPPCSDASQSNSLHFGHQLSSQ